MYTLNEQQQAIVDRAKAIADDVVASNAVTADQEARFPRASLDALAADGFLGLTVPKEHGGMGEGLRTMCAVLDQLAQRCSSTAMIYKMHLCGVSTYAAAGDRMADVLRAVASGEHLSLSPGPRRGRAASSGLRSAGRAGTAPAWCCTPTSRS